MSCSFRMALLSGEVETVGDERPGALITLSSGWLCYPGKLKPGVPIEEFATSKPCSGWLCYPGKLKQQL